MDLLGTVTAHSWKKTDKIYVSVSPPILMNDSILFGNRNSNALLDIHLKTFCDINFSQGAVWAVVLLT